MKRISLQIITSEFLIIICCSWMPATAKELTLAASLSIPPYINKDSDSGIQLEIVREALKFQGHVIKEMKYVSNKRTLQLLRGKEVDGIINVPSNIPNIFYSDTIIKYENVAIALKRNNFKINHVHDLINREILAFQNAHIYLTPEFSTMTKNNRKYREVVNQMTQVRQLYLGRTEVLIMDKRIFLYFRDLLKIDSDIFESIIFYNIFALTPRRMGFYDKQLRDEFNAGLEKMKSSGKYQTLIETHLK